jgi:hypothetical protein
MRQLFVSSTFTQHGVSLGDGGYQVAEFLPLRGWSAIGWWLSAIGYRLSAIGHRLSANG